MLHVPLIITNSGAGEGLVIEPQVGLIDLAPTILDLVGIESPECFRGRSLNPLIKGEAPMSPVVISVQPSFPSSLVSHLRIISWRSEHWKYIYTEKYDGTNVKQELYDLRNDPGETENLQESQKEKAKEL